MNRFIAMMLLIGSTLFAQTELFPGRLNIQPFAAHTLEPGMGFLVKINENDIRLDIGSSKDILHFNIDENLTLSAGADFFTFTLLRGEANFHFPVDAVDYLFGLNAGLNVDNGISEYGVRFRLSHISAHFVDGHFDGSTGKWRDGIEPKVYSREFIELIPYFRYCGLRFYGGITYLVHKDPTNIGNDIYTLGFDYYSKGLWKSWIIPFAGYDLEIENLYEYEVNHNLLAGIKLGSRFGRGLSLFIRYYNGNNIHGEYFYFKDENTAFGFKIDF